VALLENANPKNVSGGYMRVLGDAGLASLISKVQSTVISAGRELERMIISRVPKITDFYSDLDTFLLQNSSMREGVFLVPKSQLKQSKLLGFSGAEPDFVIFKNRGGKQSCHVIELKDGHVFDTKKAEGEERTMRDFIQQNAHNIPYTVKGHFCAFNQTDKSKILEGFKHKIQPEQALTGPELCQLLEIDYDNIIEERKADSSANFDYFLRELLTIPAARKRLLELLD